MSFIRASGSCRAIVRALPLFLGFSLLFAGWVTPAEAQRRLAPKPVPYSELDRREGEERLSAMREMGIEGVYTFLVEFRVLPRRGEERRLRGQVWGGRAGGLPVLRYEIWEPESREERVLRFLARNGPEPVLWRFDTEEGGDAPRRVEIPDLFDPIRATDFVPFDLQMPFLFWEDFAYEGVRRVRGRSSHVFLMYPPADYREAFPWLEGVRMFLDAEFNAVSAADIIDTRGEVVKSFNITEIKGLDGQWFPKTIDYRDRRSGDKTRMAIRGAALNLPEDFFPFVPEALTQPFPSVPQERLTFF